MKVAVATQDGIHVGDHFGQCPMFAVYEFEQGRLASVMLRRRPDGQAACAHDDHAGHAGAGDRHGMFGGLLADCDAVLVRGMGPGAVRFLTERGICPVAVTDPVIDAEQAAIQYACGRLQTGAPSCTDPGHHSR